MSAVSLPLHVLWYGKDEKPGEVLPLRAGPLDLILQGPDLRTIRFGEWEIVRRIYTAIRDQHWGTVAPVITNLVKDIREDSFRLTFDAENKQEEILFVWQGTLEGQPNGTIIYTMDGMAKSTFLKNRIGVCVLLPIKETAGMPCTVTKPDGSGEQGNLPESIAPHQPFLDIQAIRFSINSNIRVDVHFEGEVFEMEDQRNWIDGSFKIYSTPLRIPIPAEIKAGTRVFHRITLTVDSKQPKPNRPRSKNTQDILVSVSDQNSVPMPQIGTATNHDGVDLTENEISRIRALGLSHLRHDIDLSHAPWQTDLSRAVSQSKALKIPIEIGMWLRNTRKDLLEIGSALRLLSPSVCTWLILDQEDRLAIKENIQAARSELGDISPGAPFGLSTSTHFTGLNRVRPEPGSVDIAGYAFNPQVHAFDSLSIVENLEPIAHTISSAAQFLRNTPLTLGPVSLRPRNKPGLDGGIPHAVDVRQMSLLCAGWTCGCLGYAASQAVRRITLFEATGWRGVMERKNGSPVPDVFRSIPGSVFPVFHVLADAADFRGGRIARITTLDCLSLTGVAFFHNEKKRVLLANLTAHRQKVILQGWGPSATWRVMDASNALAAMQDPIAFRARPFEQIPVTPEGVTLSVEPFGVVTVDG